MAVNAQTPTPTKKPSGVTHKYSTPVSKVTPTPANVLGETDEERPEDEIEDADEYEPEFGANWTATKNSNKKDYKVFFDWKALPQVRGYSIQISKVPGAAPQKKISTYKTDWTFKTIAPGDWYVNLIAQNRDRSWSKIYYWKVTVGPKIEATETDTEDVLSVKTKVEKIMKKFSRTQAQSENDVLADSDEEDPLEEDIPILKKQFQCDCSKSCKTIRSCAEANFLLFQCGCGNLDADDDSIPCENKCGE